MVFCKKKLKLGKIRLYAWPQKGCICFVGNVIFAMLFCAKMPCRQDFFLAKTLLV